MLIFDELKKNDPQLRLVATVVAGLGCEVSSPGLSGRLLADHRRR